MLRWRAMIIFSLLPTGKTNIAAKIKKKKKELIRALSIEKGELEVKVIFQELSLKLHKNTNPYASAAPMSYDPCAVQCSPSNFKTFFGNNVDLDQKKYREINYIDSNEVKFRKAKGQIVCTYYNSKIIESFGHEPPRLEYRSGYYIYQNQLTQCDFKKYSFQITLYLKAAFKDFLFVIILTAIISSITLIISKFNFKIKITK